MNRGLNKSQSDIGVTRLTILNSLIDSIQLFQLKFSKALGPLKGLQNNIDDTYLDTNKNKVNNNHHVISLSSQRSPVVTGNRVLPQFKEPEINDGLSVAIESSYIRENELNKRDFLLSQQQQLQLEHVSSSSNPSSPSLPTFPAQLGDSSPFSEHNYKVLENSSIVSPMLKYTTYTRLQTSDINDNVNMYLSRLVDYFVWNESKINKEIPLELLSPPMNSAPYIDISIDPELHTVFYWACSMGTLPIIEALYQVGSSPRVVNSSGQTPLMGNSMFHNSHTKKKFPELLELVRDNAFDINFNLQTVISYIETNIIASLSGELFRYCIIETERFCIPTKNILLIKCIQ